MKRTVVRLGLAGTLGFVVSLGAQSPTTPIPDQRVNTSEKAGHDIAVTGCLVASSGGSYTLTNAVVDKPMTDRVNSTTGSASDPTTATGTTGTASAKDQPTTWFVSGGSDLGKHVGHKIQVTGRTTWDLSMEHAQTSGSTVGTAGITGATGSTAQPRLDAHSVTMIASSCS